MLSVINPYQHDNDQMLQDSVTPDMPTASNELPVSRAHIKVGYMDIMLGMKRHRRFTAMKTALEFIEFRAERAHLYNFFTIQILKEGES